MSLLTRIAIATTAIAILGGSMIGPADARRNSYPLTLCGPDLTRLCPIRGFFDSTPFRYNLAIYPGCIKWAVVETPRGLRRQRVLVCDYARQSY